MPTDLSTNYFIGAIAISVLGVAVNQANITHRIFVGCLFVLSAALGGLAIFWGDIAPIIPNTAASMSELTQKQSSWLTLFIIALFVVFFLNFVERVGVFKKKWRNTHVRFIRSSATPDYYEPGQMENIYRWRQIHMAGMEANFQTQEFKKAFGIDVFIFVFEKETPYGTPRIETFGHPFPNHNWTDQTERMAVLLVQGRIDAPFFEIHFPKPNR